MFASTVLALTLFGCGTVAHTDDPSRQVAVYVYFVSAGTHEPVAGAAVHLVGKDNCVIASAVTDRFGVATFAEGVASLPAKYVFAESESFLISGARWSPGRREYNLPLQLEPAVQRLTVPPR
jgi:hypothetical protein